MLAIKGNAKAAAKCSFCKANNCRISKCAKKAGWGILMENGTKQGRPDGIAHLTRYLGSLMRVDNIHLLSDWPSSHPSNIQIGVPGSARHMVIHGCHVYAVNACQYSSLKKVETLCGDLSMYP